MKYLSNSLYPIIFFEKNQREHKISSSFPSLYYTEYLISLHILASTLHRSIFQSFTILLPIFFSSSSFHQPNHFPPSLLPLHPPLRIQKHVFLNSSRIRGQFRILPTWHANVHNRFILLTSFMDLIIATGWKETQKNVEVEEEKGVV